MKDLAAELLHNTLPEQYPLMQRWVWDTKSNSGVLREIWHGEDVDAGRIEVPDGYATFLALREELSGYLTQNGVFRDVPWYAGNRDLPEAPYAATHLYRDLEELRDRHAEAVRAADLVVLGSFVPDGPVVARWVLATATGKTAFYDIDTPATLAALEGDGCAYLDRAAKIGRAHV